MADYGKTLNLPKTKFPMRANLPQREPEIQKLWESKELYEKSQARAKRNNAPSFILHDGPPYANGHIHIGHALNKILKDIVLRYKTMRGFYTPYIPGWDTHGLPIEQQVIKTMGVNRHEVPAIDFRRSCRDYALKFVQIQKEEFKRLGCIGDWEHPYLTLTPDYEAKQIEVFGEMAQRGYIYKGKKPVYWCPHCETALAEAEIEYADHASPSIYVKFPVAEAGDKLPQSDIPTYFVIWTTTPWTLPANLAVCLHPDFSYSLVEAQHGGKRERYVFAMELVDSVAKDLGLLELEEIATFRGNELEGITCRHPFIERESTVILGDHVTLEAGTGCVHTAPGHGLEDYEVGLRYNLPILAPVDEHGVLTDEAGEYAGLDLKTANKKIVADLAAAGLLHSTGDLSHQYPHCWRCKEPVIFRATAQWFASVEGFRKEALEAIKSVNWIPSWGQERIYNMVAERRDWCISRQRIWGVPIPIFYCEDCGGELITKESISAVADLFSKEGSDGWYTHEAREILPPGTKCKCGSSNFRKESDIMDVWFDSGSSHTAVVEQRPELSYPADLYLEGSDQHRGWFQSSLLTAIATKGSAPYRSVLTHGYTVDAEGKKMSKSLGNVVAPEKVIKQYGADILRLWVASADYKNDVRISDGILKQMSEVYRRIRNTCRFIIGNLGDFDPKTDAVSYEALTELDRWALMELQQLTDKVTQAYENYDFHLLYHSIHNFCAVQMSAFYLDVVKDRLYVEAPTSQTRRAVQTVIFEVLQSLVRLLAPVLAHTAEEIWQHLPESCREVESVHLASWPQVEERYLDEKLAERFENMLRLRGEISKALERARAQKLIGSSLEAEVQIYGPQSLAQIAEDFPAEYMMDLAIVSDLSWKLGEEPQGGDLTMEAEELRGVTVVVNKAQGYKCERCWKYTPQEDLCQRCHKVMEELPGETV